MLEKIAKKELVYSIGTDRFNELTGPVLEVNELDYIVLRWHKVLEFGDTAFVFVEVNKNQKKFSKVRSITMNYEYKYLEGPISSFTDIFPTNITGEKIRNLKVSIKQDSACSNTRFVIDLDRLVYYLQEGYFEILEKNEKYTIVDFYQVIAEITHPSDSNKIPTAAAMLIFSETNRITICPIKEPDR